MLFYDLILSHPVDLLGPDRTGPELLDMFLQEFNFYETILSTRHISYSNNSRFRKETKKIVDNTCKKKNRLSIRVCYSITNQKNAHRTHRYQKDLVIK
jgi:hypothetical protein